MIDKKILVTGLNSLIGWHVFKQLKGYSNVLGTYGKAHAIFEGEDYIKLDLDSEKEVEKLILSYQPDYIVHTRGICDLDLCESMPEMAWTINLEGTRKLLNAVHKLSNLPRLVYLSTDHVFDGEAGPYHEEHLPSPKHVYGKTKAATEELVKDSGLAYLIIRPGLVIGESFQGNKGPRDFLFSRIRAEKPTHLFTDEWRTPIQAHDLANQIIELMQSSSVGVYHLAGEEIYNRFDLGRHLAVECGLPTEQIFPRKREEDVWSHIRPRNISLTSIRKSEES